MCNDIPLQLVTAFIPTTGAAGEEERIPGGDWQGQGCREQVNPAHYQNDKTEILTRKKLKFFGTNPWCLKPSQYHVQDEGVLKGQGCREQVNPAHNFV